MRITPTQDQMSYLTSIGVAKATISQPHGAAAPARRVTPSPSPSRDASVHWWAVAVIIAMLVLMFAGLARGQTSQPAPSTAPAQNQVTPDGHEGRQGSPVASEGQTQKTERENWVEAMMQAVPLPGELAGLLRTRQALEQQVGASEHRLAVHVEQAQQIMEGNTAELRAAQQALGEDLIDTSHHLSDRLDAINRTLEVQAQHTDRSIDSAERAMRQDLRAESGHLESRINTQNHTTKQVITGAAVGLAVILVLVVVWRVQMKHDIRQISETVMTHSANLADDSSVPAENRANGGIPSTGQQPDAMPQYEPQRAKRALIPEPPVSMNALIETAKRLPHVSNPPIVPAEPWTLGMTTVKGNVRSENQDYGMCFRVAGHDVLVVADGCGGVKHGRRAAYLAAMSATASVARAYGVRQRWHVPHVEDVAIRALKSAAHTLAVEGDKLNITDVRGGLRTTLIVVVGNSRDIGFAYIGDGGGCVVKSTGEVRRFLDPQKADALAMNVLAASLGPQTEGDPVSGVMTRDPGDLVMIGSDGIFDRVDADFPRDVMRGCIQHQGGLQDAADQIVAELAAFRDSAGYICDDNLSLGLMGDGSAPKLSPGFWSASQGHDDGGESPVAELTGDKIKEMV